MGLAEGDMMRFLLVIFVFLFSVAGQAGDIEAAFNALKQSGVNYEPDGAVCEQVARLKLEEEFSPDKYFITGGIEYDTGEHTLGELDVVIVDKTSNKVVMVAEVKCWRNLWQAMDKLKAQRDRFTWNLSQFPHRLRFTSYDGVEYRVEQFAGLNNFRSISQAGGLKRGFDVELDFTLSELRELRMKLLKCQSWGECARPQ